MLNRELLIAGACMGGIYGVGQVHEYHGFRLQRANTGNGSIITYKAADGTLKDMLVLDAKYRSVQRFGLYHFTIPQLPAVPNIVHGQSYYINGSSYAISDKTPMPNSITNDLIYNNCSAYVTEKTAKENCDIWIANKDMTSSYCPEPGVPAVEHCRSQIVNGEQCDLPNKYQVIVIWACGDKLDEIDPTAPIYPGLKLGYTAIVDFNGTSKGRCQILNGIKSDMLFASTDRRADYIHCMGYDGKDTAIQKYNLQTAVPVLEL